MGLFSRRKNKENNSNKIDAAFNRVYSQIGKIDSWEDPKKLEHYILDSCEQIIASTKEMERQKAEYRVVTKYLNDIKTIEELPPELGGELRLAASRITELETSILNSKNIHRNITEEQFSTIAQEEDELPQIINRLAADERYQEQVKRDMNYLEGEKSRWEIERENLSDQKKVTHKVGLAVLTSFTALILLLFTIATATGSDLALAELIVFLICAIVGSIIYFKQNDIKKKSHIALVRLNQSISVLNVQRMKYVNVTNGIEFQKDKYSVESAAELQYVWQQYMDSIKDQERLIKNNEDLDFYSGKLRRILSQLELHDKRIWMTQTNALVNKEDMVEVRHKLVARRQKIRDRIEENQRIVQNERDEIDRLMIEHEHYLPEIQEIIKSVDKLCGTSASGAALKNKKKSVAS